MKAAIVERYGPPEVIQIRDIPKPEPGPGEMLVRVHAATATPADCAFRKADPFIVRFFSGLLRPRQPIPGDDFAGVVEALGVDCTLFEVGDRVFGSAAGGGRACAEYMRVAENSAVGAMPDQLDYGPAACLSYSFLTAMPFLRDEANLQAGQHILINGASGSIGTVAVQLARHLGARVTAVCSTRNVELVRQLGADEVIDYTQEDFTARASSYDIVFDAVGKSSFAACRNSLTASGGYLTTVPSFKIVYDMLTTRRSRGQWAKLATTGLRPTALRRADIAVLAELFESGVLHAIVDRTYPLDRLAEAHAYVETGHKRGDLVIAIPG